MDLDCEEDYLESERKREPKRERVAEIQKLIYTLLEYKALEAARKQEALKAAREAEADRIELELWNANDAEKEARAELIVIEYQKSQEKILTEQMSYYSTLYEEGEKLWDIHSLEQQQNNSN